MHMAVIKLSIHSRTQMHPTWISGGGVNHKVAAYLVYSDILRLSTFLWTHSHTCLSKRFKSGKNILTFYISINTKQPFLTPTCHSTDARNMPEIAVLFIHFSRAEHLTVPSRFQMNCGDLIKLWYQLCRSIDEPFVMMMSSNWNIFLATGPLCGEFIGHRWIPLRKASDAELWCFLWSAAE